MKITVDNQETLNALTTICSAACRLGDLRLAKTAIIVIEATFIKEPDNGHRKIIGNKRIPKKKTKGKN